MRRESNWTRRRGRGEFRATYIIKLMWLEVCTPSLVGHGSCILIKTMIMCRRKKLDEIKQRKLAELKAVGIPDKYCAEVSRRITAPPPSFTMSGLH